MKTALILVFSILLMFVFVLPVSAGLLTPEEGQDLFDAVFWLVLSVFVMGLTAGLAIKMINRS